VDEHDGEEPLRETARRQSLNQAGGHGSQNFRQIDGRDIVREDVRLTIFPVSAYARDLEVDLTWQAIKAPVTLRGSQEPCKSYCGLSARFAARENTFLRADGEIVSKDEDLTPRKWAELDGVYGDKRAVLRITPDPTDTGFPYQYHWCLHNGVCAATDS